ncbi:MAG: hypothetical protein QXU18_11310 [Thermoplasmatales archaeon]
MFFVANAVYSLIKLPPTFRKLYRNMKKRIGRNKALLALARKLAVVINKMLTKKHEFVENHLLQSLKRGGRRQRNQHQRDPANSPKRA